MRRLIPVILSGGSGTRLWPLSRELTPKQLLPLTGEHSLLQKTIRRVAPLEGSVDRPLVICNDAHLSAISEQLAAIGAEHATIVLEPAGRNTAPAVAVAALLAGQESGDDPLLLVLPADHVIQDEAAFRAAVGHALDAAGDGRLVTFGIVPDRPETGYGYIRSGEAQGAWADVAEFVEKPDAETARAYVESGDYLWNSGMFLFSAGVYLEALGTHRPDILAACERALAEAATEGPVRRLGQAFAECPADSIDYAVMEKTGKAAVVPLDAGWSDVGSWAALHEVLDKDADGNVLRGDVAAAGCRNTLVLSSGRTIAALGLEDCVVVETPDAVLVMTQREAQRLKGLVEALKRERSDLA